MSVPLATFGDTAADYVTGLERLRGPVTVIRRCAALTELLAACESGLAEAAVITEQLEELTGHLIERMARIRVPVIVLTADREQADRLTRLGARVLAPTISAEDLTAAVLAAVADPVRRPDEADPGPGPGGARAAGNPEDDAATSDADAGPAAVDTTSVDTTGSDTAGSDTAGSDTAGSDTIGSAGTGPGVASSGAVGSGAASSGAAGPAPGDGPPPGDPAPAPGDPPAEATGASRLAPRPGRWGRWRSGGRDPDTSADSSTAGPQQRGGRASRRTGRPAAPPGVGGRPLNGGPRVFSSAGPASAAGPAGKRAAGARAPGRRDDPEAGRDGVGAGRNDDALVAGMVIAVWGPAGAPGRSTVAVNLAAELAADLGCAYLVDADTYGSSTAVMLGLLDESAPLAQACRLADQGLLDIAALHRVSADVVIAGGRLRALTGITRPDRWPELRSSALGTVIETCRATAPATVIDCGFCLEADEELSFDSLAPRRNGATLRSLELADVIVAVGSADAIGLPRLVKGLTELADVVPGARPVVAINRVRRETVGRGSRQQVRQAWERYGPDLPITALLPWDAAADAALLGGTVLRETAPAGALRAGIRTLVPAELTLDSPGDAADERVGGRARSRP